MWKWSELKRLLKGNKSDTADLGAIMWPVIYPSDMMPPENPHVTVVIFEDINNPSLGYTLEDVMEVVRRTTDNMMLWLRVEDVEWFGAEKDVPVLRVWHDFLPVYRKKVMAELEARGIPVDMKFPIYKPHCTITNETVEFGQYPEHLLAGTPEVWWGDEKHKIVFNEDPKIQLRRNGEL